jgi:trimeric autotransporter adhesin
LHALLNNTTGGNNIGLGVGAGQYLTTGSNNIDIDNSGVPAESNTIRIGTQATQTATFITGIFGKVLTGGGDAVVVSSAGQLGIAPSSARYKRDIHDMGTASAGLLKLRPVTFRYRQDPKGERQYGLIAEEVEHLYPELVSYDTDGKAQTVRYLELIPLLVNELQKQVEQNRRQSEQIRELSARVAQLNGKFERAMAGQKDTNNLAAALSR